MPSYKLSYFNLRGCVHDTRLVPLTDCWLYEYDWRTDHGALLSRAASASAAASSSTSRVSTSRTTGALYYGLLDGLYSWERL
jgi:hypothetical protein